MSQRDHEGVLAAYAAAKNRHDVDAILETLHADCYYESVAFGGRIQGKDALRFFYGALFEGLPDYFGDFDGQILSGDNAAVWGRFGGTVRGHFMGLAPTGRRIEVPVVFMVTFRSGLISSDTGYFDLATLCEQAGIPIESLRATMPAPKAVA